MTSALFCGKTKAVTSSPHYGISPGFSYTSDHGGAPAGWRKFFVVSIGDMLAATDRLGAPDTPGHGSRAHPAFYIACSRFLPGTNMKTAAHLMYLHMHHHLKLGFQARALARCM